MKRSDVVGRRQFLVATGGLAAAACADSEQQRSGYGPQSETWTIPPGGGATFGLTIPEAGKYPFVTHSFAYTGLGAVGLIEVK